MSDRPKRERRAPAVFDPTPAPSAPRPAKSKPKRKVEEAGFEAGGEEAGEQVVPPPAKKAKKAAAAEPATAATAAAKPAKTKKEKVIHPWESIPRGNGTGKVIRVFKGAPEKPADYATFNLGVAKLTRGAKALALKNSYDMYEHMSWDIQPKKYGPKAYALSVPAVVLSAAKAKIKWEREQEKLRAERRKANPRPDPLIKAREIATARTRELFPSMPEGTAETIVRRAWSDGHVGTLKYFDLDTKVMLAVEAHVRYQETEFEEVKDRLYEERRERREYNRDRYDRYDRYDDDDDNPYESAWHEVKDDIVEVMTEWMAPPGTVPTAEMRTKADKAIHESMSNNYEQNRKRRR